MYLVGVIHAHRNARSFKLVHLHHFLLPSPFRREHQLQRPRSRRNEISTPILITESMSSNDNRLDPPRDGLRNSLEDNWFAENSSSKDIADLFKVNVYKS